MPVSITQQVLASPQAVMIFQEVQRALTEESKRRTTFYNDLEEDTKAEFINGQVIMHSPNKDEHTKTRGLIETSLQMYVNAENLGAVRSEQSLVALTRNDYMPDVAFFKTDKAKDINKKGVMLYPAPDLVVEILSKSTKSRDKGVKFKDYEAHGISEYWIIDPEKEKIWQYHLSDGKYNLILEETDGIIESIAVDGFIFPIRAFFDAQLNVTAIFQLLQAHFKP